MSIRRSQQLKQFESRKAKLEVDIQALFEELKQKQREHNKAINQLKLIQQQIESLKDTEVVVTEHAILRYLERVMQLDVDEVKSKILTQNVIALIKNMGNGKYPLDDGSGLRAVVKNNTVVSVM